jgi:hypothetical protein
MRLTTLLILATALLSPITPAFSALPDRLPVCETLQSGSDGFTVAINLPDAELKGIGDADQPGGCRIDIPGATPDFDGGGISLPALTRLIAVPDGYRAEARVVDRRDRIYEASAYMTRDAIARRELRNVYDPPPVEVGKPGWMRWLRVAPVVIHPARYLPETRQIASAERLEIEFRFVPDNSPSGITPDLERYWSQAYEELFSALLLNPDQLPHIPVGGKPVVRGSYVIITDSALVNTTTQFAEWKRRKGFDVRVEPMYIFDVTTKEDIKEFLQDAYDNWERPPEFALLLGDVNNVAIQLPAYYVQNPKDPQEDDPTDQPYTYLSGDDYFPDILIGRISCGSPSPSDAPNAFARVIRQERDLLDLHGFDAGAFHRATLFAGNFGDAGLPVISPVETCRWLGGRLRGRGWDVDEFYYYNVGDDINPEPIVQSINRGVNVVAYRGWGDATGPHYPEFKKPNLDQLDNGPLLPVFTIFVCGTGRYSDNAVNPCFGEYSITRADPYPQRAALAFFGPSDLHTNTKYNNSLLGGYYSGLLYENMRVLGQLVLRSKMGLWSSFPHERGEGDNVWFYFSVYNILGDPELNLYLDAPQRLHVVHPDTLTVGATECEATVTDDDGAPVRGALVTLLKGEETNISVLSDADGLALIPVELDSEGTLQLTAIAHQMAPYLKDIPVRSEAQMLGFAGVSITNDFGDNRLVVGSDVNLRVTIRNTGNQAANGVTTTLTSPLEKVEIIDGSAIVGDIAAGGSAPAGDLFTVRLDPGVGYLGSLPFQLDIADGAGNHYPALFRLNASNGALAMVSYELSGGFIDPGETKSLTLAVKNFGNMDLDGVYAVVHSFDNAVSFPDDRMGFGDIAAGDTEDCVADPAELTIANGVRIGRQIALRLDYYDGEDHRFWFQQFNITVGQVGIEHPIGPDGYGYYAYEDIDTAYSEAPVFNWVELDPDYDGSDAELYEIVDDHNVIVELPFTFRYYGYDFLSITICDNGWLCFDRTWMADFNNWGIPSPLGPHNLVAPFWDDLTRPDPDHPGDRTHRLPVKVFTRYDDNPGRFIIQWSRAHNRYGLENQANFIETFEVILYDPQDTPTATGDGEIGFQYLDVNNADRENNFATVGIENWNHGSGLELTYAGFYHPAIDTLRPNRAIKFTTDAPDEFLSAGSESAAPLEFRLDEPYPNPFNAAATIAFSLPQTAKTELALWDIHGRIVKVVELGVLAAGVHQRTLSAAHLPSGIYILKLTAGARVAERKAVLIR